MLSIKSNVTNIKGINDQILKIKRTLSQEELNRFIQKKSIETLQQVMNERLIGGTTNDGAIPLYRQSNHVEETINGFILYNNATIGADCKNPENYPNGEFSIALAFEYGVGIVGQNTVNDKAWEYNINNYNFGWYFKPENGDSKWQQTAGYTGFEIYRYTADRINKNLKKWLREYYSNKGVQK